jgi:hypothetical protein
MSRRARKGLLIVCAAALLATAHGRANRERDDLSPARAAESLRQMNDLARSAYAATRERLLAGSGPVVLFDGENLVFRYGDYRNATKPTPALYHDLKTVGHVALGVYALLAVRGDGPLDDRRLFLLARYQESIDGTRKAIRHRGLTTAQVERQDRILDACRTLVESARKDRKVEVKAVITALRKLRPLLDLNNSDAARAQIDGLHREMTAYRDKLSEIQWKQLRVIVQGSQMPRRNNLAVQYFARLLGEKGEGKRIVYAEGLFDETRALRLLGTHLIDTRLGEDLFEDPLYMHSDLLGTAARTYLDELFRKKE